MSKFTDDLKRGKIAELLLLELWPGLTQTDGFRGDFITAGGEVVESKGDYYDMQKTENFFLEKWSDVDNKKPGGPWQALEHGATLFVYLYVKNRTFFVFKTHKLLETLEAMEPTLRPVRIQNQGWVTVGYLVPRKLLAPFFEMRSFE